MSRRDLRLSEPTQDRLALAITEAVEYGRPLWEAVDAVLGTPTTFSVSRYASAERIVEATGAEICWGHEGPCYERPPLDRILLPARTFFLDSGQLTATLLHEILHWSEWRLGWPGTNQWTEDERYAVGELRAEIGTVLFERKLRLPHCDDLTNYEMHRESWLGLLRNDPSLARELTRSAVEATEFILGLYQRYRKGRAGNTEMSDHDMRAWSKQE